MEVLIAVFKANVINRMVYNYDLSNALALLYLQQYALKDEQISTKCSIRTAIFDEDSSDDSLIEQLRPNLPDVVAFSCYLWNYERTLAFCRSLKKIFPKTCTVLGGPEASDPQLVLKYSPTIDFCIAGEGEEPFCQLLRVLLSGERSLKEITGLNYRRGNEIHTNQSYSLIKNIEDIPSVYTPENLGNMKGMIFYETSRGCVNQCRYCVSSLFRKRFFSLERIERELKTIFNYPDITHLDFIDTALDESLDRFKELLRIIIKHNIRHISSGGFLYLNRIDEEVISLMKQAIFRNIRFGFESADPHILQSMGREKIKPHRIENMAHFLRDPFFNISTAVMYLIPGDTYKNLKNTLRTILDYGISEFSCTRFMVFPGTWYYKNAEEEGLIFDPLPPHFLIASRTSTKEEIDRAEQFCINLKILTRFFNAPLFPVLEHFGIDLIDVAENIHIINPDWFNHYIRPRRTDIDLRLSNKIFIVILDYLKKKKLAEKEIHLFEDILTFRYCEIELSGSLTENEAGYQRIENIEEEMKPVVHRFIFYPFKHDMCRIMKKPEKATKEIQPKKTLVFFFVNPIDRTIGKIVPKDYYYLRSLADNLFKGNSVGEVYRQLQQQYPKLTKKSFLAELDELNKLGVMYFKKCSAGFQPAQGAG
ncbi:MAG: radical SAM protein [bacterium]